MVRGRRRHAHQARLFSEVVAMTEIEINNYCSEQKAKRWTTTTVLKKVKDLFPQENPVAIMVALDSCKFNGPRIQLAILKCCDGSLEDLQRLIEVANEDEKAVLLVEYRNQLEYEFNHRQPGLGTPIEIYQKDLDEYLA